MMRRADYGVVILAVGVLIAVYTTYWHPQQQAGTTARISVGRAEVLDVSLKRDQRLPIQGPLGTSVIEIHDGRVRFIDSPCRGKQCIHAGWLQHDGDFAACLPNGISITVGGGRHSYDSINF